jgi:hypothetical protein
MTWTRKIGIANIIPVSFFLLMGTLLLVGCKKSVPYVLIPDRTTELTVGSPVEIEGVVVGTVDAIQSSNRFPGKQVVRIELDNEYSIPSNSKVRLIKSTNGGKMILQIVVVASKSYLNPGDTVYFSVPALPKIPTENQTVEAAEDLVYRVQLFASKKSQRMGSPVLKGIENVEEVFDGTLYKYYVGRSSTLAEAKTVRQTIGDRGIKDAFIVAFVNGERISLDQANQYEK